MPPSITLNSLLARDEVARVVDRDELPVVSSDATTYGLAMIVDKNFNVVYHAQKGDPPRRVGEGEFTLIATNEILRINFLSSVPNNDNKRAVGFNLDPVKEIDGVTGKERVVRLRATLEFKIDRHNREVANEIYARMRERRNATRLTKKQLLSGFGADLKEHVQNFIQTAVDDVGVVNLSTAEMQEVEKQKLGPVMSKMGLIFGDIVINPDKRSAWQRLILPSPNYDYRWVLALKLIIPIVTTTASALVALYGIGVFERDPVLTIGPHEHGTVQIIEVNCASTSECSVSRGNDLSLSVRADEGYKLVELRCSGECPEEGDLKPAESVKIEDIRGDLTIAPDFRRAGTLRIDSAKGGATCIVISDEQSGASCKEVVGGRIRLTVDDKIAIDEQSIEVFEEWACAVDNWCDGADLRSADTEITVPQELGEVSISPIFRTHKLVTIQVRPSEPPEANVANAEIKDGCLAAESCTHKPEGPVDFYTFQVSEDGHRTVTLTAPEPSAPDSFYSFVSWECDPDSVSCESRGNEVDLTLTDNTGNIEIRGVYSEQNVFTIMDATQDKIDLGRSTLPDEGCTEPPVIRCVFNQGESIEVEIFPQVSSGATTIRFIGWRCLGAPCEGMLLIEARNAPDRVYHKTLSDSVTITPFFEDVNFTVLSIREATGGDVSADCERTNNLCRDESGWSTALTARASSGHRFVRWDCDGAPCPGFLEANPLSLILDGDVTITPIFEQIPMTRLTVGQSINGRASAICESAETKCYSEVGWRTAVRAFPDRGFRFVSWNCSGASCPDTSRTANPLWLILNDDVTITPMFEPIPTVSLSFGMPRNGRVTADCDSNCEREPGWRATVTAEPNAGYKFDRWECSGNCPSGAERPVVELTIRENTRITPVFRELITVRLTIRVGEGGRVEHPLSQSACQGQNVCTYNIDIDEGSNIRLDADASTRYEFGRWIRHSGNSFSADGEDRIRITLTQNTELEVTFTRRDDGGDRDSATSINLGDTLSGRIESGGDHDYFRFTVPRSGTLTIFTSGDTDTFGTLQNASGATLERNDDSGNGTNFRIVRDVSSGTYYIAVRHFSSSGTGDYRLSLRFE